MDLTILTGKRPHLLAKTLASLPQDLLYESNLIVLHNGGDELTGEVLDGLKFIDKRIVTDKFYSIGKAISMLMAETSSEYVLHLEDDWTMGEMNGWLELSKYLLETYDLVKLRHHSQRTLNYNMVDKKPLIQNRKGKYSVNNGHYSFNPCLQKLETVKKIFPCENETDAQRKFYSINGTVAQLNPGLFYHIGDDESLRENGGQA